ncbi:MAG: hypothetical protein AB7V77_03735 [Candidatus Woesearchaeota archaeon]
MEIELIKNIICDKIKEKKELNSLDNDFVKSQLNNFLLKNKINLEKLFSKYNDPKKFQKSSYFKEIISGVRSNLREIYGVFIKKSLSEFNKKILSINSFEDEVILNILKSHQSSNERLQHYSNLYEEIFNILFDLGLSKKYSVLDLACGFNPFAYNFFKVKPQFYFASDLSQEDMSLVNLFFKKLKISGEAKALDLLNPESINFLNNQQKFDVCFLFKALDSLETKQRHSSKNLISSLNCKYFVVSFPKLTIGGKKSISESKRTWFEKFCIKEFKKFEKFELPNEVLYIFSK